MFRVARVVSRPALRNSGTGRQINPSTNPAIGGLGPEWQLEVAAKFAGSDHPAHVKQRLRRTNHTDQQERFVLVSVLNAHLTDLNQPRPLEHFRSHDLTDVGRDGDR